jgi:uncharacterized protein
MTTPRPVSVKALARRQRAEDARLRKAAHDAAHKPIGKPSLAVPSADSFTNFAYKLGIGADNPLTSAGYGFNPITRIRTLLEWIHRGSWLGGVAVDTIADDMTRAGVSIKGEMQPQDISKIEAAAARVQFWPKLNETLKWARLYGGCLAVFMVEGQNYATPLRVETIGKGQFKGLLVLDRWMVEPSLARLVMEEGNDIGLPEFYDVTADAPALRRMRIHHSRCIRLEGIRLPYWQRVMENLWGISVLERLYDRLIAFDSATTGAAQLVYKSYLRTYKVPRLRDIAARGGPALDGLIKMMDVMRRYQSIEGITMIDGEDELDAMQGAGFTGISEALIQFKEQLAGALETPLVRLFGQSPSGFSTGDTDLRMYYDMIKHRQQQELHSGVRAAYMLMCRSEGLDCPPDFDIEFLPLWQLTAQDKADVAGRIVAAVKEAQEARLISDRTAMQELKQSSAETGIFTNITDEDIEAADEKIAPPAPTLEMLGQGGGVPGKPALTVVEGGKRATDSGDATRRVAEAARRFGVQVAIEQGQDEERLGSYGSARQPQPYGYIRGTVGADGDQVDCFLGEGGDGIFVLAQRDLETGAFDEHKVMLGFDSLGDALACYVAAYPDGSGAARIQSIEPMDVNEFQRWIEARAVGAEQRPVTHTGQGLGAG